MYKTILKVGVTMLLSLASFSVIFGQPNEKIIRVIDKFSKKRIQPPVAVVDLRSEGKIIDNQKPFIASDNWLRQTEITLKNISDRPIVNVVLHVWFQNERGLQTPIPISFLPYSTKGTARGRLVSPNETITINLGRSHQYFTDLKSKIPVLSVELSVEFVYFDNNTAWSKGAILVQDPQKPETWINTKYLEQYKNDVVKKANLSILPINYINSTTDFDTLFNEHNKQYFCYDLQSQSWVDDYCEVNINPCSGEFCNIPPLLREFHIRVPVADGFNIKGKNSTCKSELSGCYCCNNSNQDCPRIFWYLDEPCNS